MRFLKNYIEYRMWKQRQQVAVSNLRVQAEHPGTERQLRRYLNAIADLIEGA